MKIRMNFATFYALATVVLISLCAVTSRAAAQEFKVPSTDVGTTVDLIGQWLFKPSYALAAGETPEKSDSTDGYVSVAVPQMLSRIQWWLDDSEDFRKWEQARLDKLGFDTEKSDDGWYRLVFDCPALPKERRLWIEFEGVAMRSKAFINGQALGEHEGMFHRFSYDLTPHLKLGRNVLSMWVGMERIPQTDVKLGEAVTVNLSAAKVISMSKGMFGPLTPNQDNRAYDLYGIWQPVKLVVRGEAKIEDVWFKPSTDGAEVLVDAVPSDAARDVFIRATIKHLDNSVLSEQTLKTHLLLESSAYSLTRVLVFRGLQPQLWTPAQPNLYRLEVNLESPEGKLIDKWSQKVGFRTFEIKGNEFYLNGKPYWLRGANQLPYGKNPWDKDLPRKLIQLLHDGNIRFTRTHCTPWNEAWLDAADEIGLAVSIEGIRPWAFAGRADQIGRELLPPPQIFQHWLMENDDVVRRCRNHPSVFIFTVGNEMLLRDGKNMTKWELLSQVTKQTRQLAPQHPIVVSSDYVRDPQFYESTLKPAGIDDGDIDDIHRYNGWYSDSPFVLDSRFEKEAKQTGRKRPMIGQEMSSGYPDLDTGLPVLRYTRDLLTPQAWIGNLAYPGNDPKWFLDHHAKVTKRWAEQLRWQRDNTTAGFSLFSAECWFRHSYLPEAEPYPVYEAVRDAFAPVGLALETTQRRFYSGDVLRTNVYITNDDEHFRDLENLELMIAYFAGLPRSPIGFPKVKIAGLKYYQTLKVPVELKLPELRERRSITLLLSLSSKETKILESLEPIEIFPRSQLPATGPAGNVIVIEKGQPLAGLAEGQPLRARIEQGATAIVFSPSKEIVALFPDHLLDVKTDIGEFVDFAPCAGTKLAENLQPLDLKWWARKNDSRAFVANSSHRLRPGGRARELIRFIPSHSYIPAERLPEQYRAVMSEIPLGKGRLWICDLAIADSIDIDPVARIFADNLYRAAADPESTTKLPNVPSHEELLKGAD